MNDVRAEKGVEIQINKNVANQGTNIWVNVDGRCAVRVLVDPDAVIAIEDNRIPIPANDFPRSRR